MASTLRLSDVLCIQSLGIRLFTNYLPNLTKVDICTLSMKLLTLYNLYFIYIYI